MNYWIPSFPISNGFQAWGGHFLSDNLWSFGMVYLTGLLLSVIMRLDSDNNPPKNP